jgi:hypothetical protein
MRRNPTPRSQRPDCLMRPPCRADGHGQSWAEMFDPAASLAELADLFAGGLISRRELERQMAKVFAAVTSSSPTAAALRPYAEPPPPPRRASRRPACDRSSSGGT